MVSHRIWISKFSHFPLPQTSNYLHRWCQMKQDFEIWRKFLEKYIYENTFFSLVCQRHFPFNRVYTISYPVIQVSIFNSLVKISMMSFIAFCIKSIIIVKRKLPSGLKIWNLSCGENNILLILLRPFVKYCFHHLKIKFISSCHRVISLCFFSCLDILLHCMLTLPKPFTKKEQNPMSKNTARHKTTLDVQNLTECKNLHHASLHLLFA